MYVGKMSERVVVLSIQALSTQTKKCSDSKIERYESFRSEQQSSMLPSLTEATIYNYK